MWYKDNVKYNILTNLVSCHKGCYREIYRAEKQRSENLHPFPIWLPGRHWELRLKPHYQDKDLAETGNR